MTNIIDPSRSVEGNFRVYTLETMDGEVLTGLLASESQDVRRIDRLRRETQIDTAGRYRQSDYLGQIDHAGRI